MKNKAFYIFLLLGIATFGLDLLTPRGAGAWAVYILLIVAYVRVAYSKFIFPLTGIYAAFLIIGYILSPEGVLPNIAIINRIASLIIIGFIAYLAHRESLIRKVNAEILDRISDSFIALDKNWNITYINRVAAGNTVISGDITGKSVWTSFPQMKGTVYESNYRKAMDTLQPVKFRAPGAYTNLDFEVSVYPSKEGLTLYGRDISELMKKESELQKSLSQQEMLVKEIHHRVKNNFQLVSSLIRLSVLNINDELIIKTVADIEARIRTLSLIHEQLYRGAAGNFVDMNIYLKYLISQLEHLISKEKKIIHNISIDKIELDIDIAIAIGLVVNELYSNSIKHGFTNRTEGEISLKMHFTNEDKKHLMIEYKDNGSGIPKSEDIFESDSMGITIIRTLIEQYHGTIKLHNGYGLNYNIFIPLQNREEQ
jgi:two-component sensor histidine kinase